MILSSAARVRCPLPFKPKSEDEALANSQWSEAVHPWGNKTKSSNQAWQEKVVQYQAFVANLTQQTLTTNAASAQSADRYIGVENTRDGSARVLNDYLNQILMTINKNVSRYS